VLESLAYDYNPSGTIHDMTDHNGLHVFGYDHTQQLTWPARLRGILENSATRPIGMATLQSVGGADLT